MSHDSNNPYASPRELVGDLANHPGLVGTLAHRSWAYRCIHLSGCSDAVIEYNGRGLGFETVLVDGDLAARESGRYGFASPINFAVAERDQVFLATIEVKTAALLFLGAFRLTIDGYLIYAEGSW